MTCSSTKATSRSPRKEAIMPVARPFLLESGTMLSAAIQGLEKSAGEYQMAPSTQRMTADTRMAQGLK
jgi:hypothetical protein